jgi:hypothetical protein
MENSTMRLSRLISRKCAILLWVALLAAGLAIWWVQPWILSSALGLDEFQDDGRLAVLRQWSAGRLAPMTPLGLFSLFPVVDLLPALILLAAMIVLIIRLFTRSSNIEHGAWPTEVKPRVPVGRVRFRFCAIVGLIALIALACGWEALEWKKWRLHEKYIGLADGYGASAVQCRRWLRQIDLELTRLDADNAARQEDAAVAANHRRQRDYFERRLVYTSALIKEFDDLSSKYTDAANHPLQLIPPDPLLPPILSRSFPGAEDYAPDHGQILAAYEELVRSFPKSARAHQGRAWILATCPDGKYRDGRRAVTSATQACELTDWQEVSSLSTLAAAYAEAGDFQNAVMWEQKAGALSASLGLGGKREAARLALYQAGKPFHIAR